MPGECGVPAELHIIAPGICGPLAETTSLQSNPIITQWLKKLSKANTLPSSGNSNDIICSLFDLDPQVNFPSAAFTLLANNMYDPDKFYMHADPVHLRADIDSAILTPASDLNISAAESKVFCETLNQHFAQDGLLFHTLNNTAWFVSSDEQINLKTTPLVSAIGRNINFILPDGEDATHWKKILTEAQMLMHSHALNDDRENLSKQSINSLWFHGSGQLIQADSNGIQTLCSDQDVLKGFAEHVSCEYFKRPDSVNVYKEYLLSCKKEHVSGINVLHLTMLEHLVNYTDVRPWLSQLQDVLENWLYPLLAFANKNNIKVTLYPCNETKYQFSKYDALKFWRKTSLEKHVDCY